MSSPSSFNPNSNSLTKGLSSSSFIISQLEKDEEKKSQAITETEISGESFQVSTQQQLQSIRQIPTASAPINRFSYRDVHGNEFSFDTRMIEMLVHIAKLESEKSPQRHIVNFAKTISNVCEHGIVTKELGKVLKIITTSSMGPITDKETISLNYIYKKVGIQLSLTAPAKGGISVSLERLDDVLSRRRTKLSEFDLQELSERAHQTILIGIAVRKVTDHCATLTLRESENDSRDEPHGCDLGSTRGFGCNETHANLSVSPSNFSFILLPERMEDFLEDEEIDYPCPIHFVPSTETKVFFWNVQVKISCPDYERKLTELFKEPILTHVLKDKTKLEL